MKLYGPINSGAAVGADGSATANANSAVRLSGRVAAIYVKYNDSPPAGTTDVVVKTKGTSPAIPTVTLLTIANAATDAIKYPAVPLHDAAGAAVTYDGTNEIYVSPPIDDFVNVAIAQANAADNVDVWLLLEEC